MSEMSQKCARCNGKTPDYTHETDTSSFWGIETKTQTEKTVNKTIRIFGWVRSGPYPKQGARTIRFDDEFALCGDCANLLIGRFLQGRNIPAKDEK